MVLVVLVVVVLVVEVGVVVAGVVVAGVVVAGAGAGTCVGGPGAHAGRLARSWVVSVTRWAVIVEPLARAWTLTVSPTLIDRIPSYWASTMVVVVMS